jgi:hypothetical protein
MRDLSTHSDVARRPRPARRARRQYATKSIEIAQIA